MCCAQGDGPLTDRARLAAGLAGTCGSVACVAAMVLSVAGLVGAGAATGARATEGSMVGMGPASTSSNLGGVLGFFVTIGPELLIISVLLVTLSLALHRGVAAVPALLAGALLYWGMYAQASADLMYTTIVIAYVMWGLPTPGPGSAVRVPHRRVHPLSEEHPSSRGD